MFYSNLFIIFGTTEFQTPSRAKKKTDRTRGAMEVDNVAQSDLSTKILVLHLSCNAMGPKHLWNCILIFMIVQFHETLSSSMKCFQFIEII